ncbi:hypothetical protein [Inquilinus sp. Marseille-Q2685]|uniref:hypothetical protein n=1 Tax=Inquilinus sp. Marseille-Q2685 TaxID=2866581 RepID=UPI001CE44D84|nr:hypothetical protein [Inquilinus sp. Marseille-Q2685]
MRITRLGSVAVVAVLALGGCNEQGYIDPGYPGPSSYPGYSSYSGPGRVPQQAGTAGDALQRYDAMVRAESAARSCRGRLDPPQEQRFAAVLSQAESDAAGQLASSSGAPGNEGAVWQELGSRRAANERDAASLARQRGCRSGPVEELIGAYRNFAALG